MICEICGKETNDIRKVNIEGTILSVCPTCARFGTTVIEPKKDPGKGLQKSKAKKSDEDILEKASKTKLVDEYGELVRKAREKMNMTQEQLGQKINEKKSVIANIESKSLQPDLKLIKKLELILSIKLLEEETNETKTLN